MLPWNEKNDGSPSPTLILLACLMRSIDRAPRVGSAPISFGIAWSTSKTWKTPFLSGVTLRSSGTSLDSSGGISSLTLSRPLSPIVANQLSYSLLTLSGIGNRMPLIATGPPIVAW